MEKRTAFDVDCSRLVPDCGFACPKCIEEIEAMLMGVTGVSKASIEAEGDEQWLIVEHDADMAPVEKLVDVLETLPSFFEGFFIPTVIENPEKED
ncbi:MAG: heavy-metal-associated domain-containing protein [Planctomycetota bacterium]|jgi:hypothetical protein